VVQEGHTLKQLLHQTLDLTYAELLGLRQHTAVHKGEQSWSAGQGTRRAMLTADIIHCA
jgi:hypothetical protein